VLLHSMQGFAHKMQGAVQGNGRQPAASPHNTGQGDDDESVVGSNDGPFMSDRADPLVDVGLKIHPFVTLRFHSLDSIENIGLGRVAQQKFPEGRIAQVVGEPGEHGDMLFGIAAQQHHQH